MDLYKQFPNSPLNFDEEFEDLSEIFKQYDITIFDLLSSSPVDISSKIHRSVQEINKFISILKTNERFQTTNASALDVQCLTTGDSKIDELLGGGIRTGMITEIFGESSTAKSQFCMQLTRSVGEKKENGGIEGNAVYISTEGSLETKRLIEINPKIENVFYINCSDLETQEHILNVQLPNLLNDSSKNIKLVIIDSISHHLRVELLANNFEIFKKNQKIVDELVLHLNNLSINHNICIIVTNQISDKPNSTILNTDFKKITYDYQIGWLSGWNNSSIKSRQENENDDFIYIDNKIATLGLNWTNNIGVRILVKKTYKPGSRNEHIKAHEELNYNGNGWIMKRSIKLIFSPFKNQSELKFKVIPSGIVSVDDDE